jgi:hypothetical protein
MGHSSVRLAGLLGLGLTGARVLADWNFELGRDGVATLIDGPSLGFASVTEVYDNARDDFAGGRTVLFGRTRTGAREVGDDLSLSAYSGTTLDSTITTIVNFSEDSELRRVRRTLRWYERSDSRLLGEVSAIVQFIVPLPPRTGGVLYDAEGLWDDFNILLQSDIYFTLQYTDPLGINVEDLGQRYGGPINTGSSSRFIRDFTLGQDIDLGDDQTNLGMAIRVNPIPGPGSIMLLATLPMLLRRRR